MFVRFLFIFYFSFCFNVFLSYAQITFRMDYDFGVITDGFSVKELSGGGFIITGNSGAVLKTDIYGNTLWSNQYEQTSGNDWNYCVGLLNDGGFIIGAESLSGGDYLYKIDSSGTPIWGVKTQSSFPTQLIAARQHSSGKIFFQDFCMGSVPAANVMGIGCVSNAGNILWTRKLDAAGDELSDDLCFTSDGNVVFIGSTSSYGAGNMDAYVIKTDTAGNILWSKTYGGSNHDFGHSVKETPDGGLIIFGHTESFGVGDWDVFAIKTDSFGDTIWCKTYGTTARDEGHEITVSGNDGFAFTMTDVSTNEVYLVKIDGSGNVVWGKNYIDFLIWDWKNNGLDKTMDGGYALTGTSSTQSIHLIKTDSNGNSGCNEQNYSPQSIPAAFSLSSGYNVITGYNYSAQLTNNNILTSSDSIWCYDVTSVAENEEANSLSIYPNPAESSIIISAEGKNNKDNRLLIYGLPGNILINCIIPRDTNKIQLDISQWPNGIYVCKIINRNGNSTQGKMVIVH